MKKWYALIIGSMLIAGTAQAGCGTCGGGDGHTHDSKKKAACEMKAAEQKAECAMTEAKCSAEQKAECAKKKAECASKKACCGTCKGGKKWYNPVSWFK